MPHLKLTLVSIVAVIAVLKLHADAHAQESTGPPAPKDHSSTAQLPALLEAKPLTVSPTDDELVKLLKSRHNVAVKQLHMSMLMYKHGTASLDDAFDAARRVGHSKLELARTAEERMAVRADLFELAKRVEDHARAMRDAATGPASDYWKARYYRLDTEIQLLRARRALENTQPNRND